MDSIYGVITWVASAALIGVKPKTPLGTWMWSAGFGLAAALGTAIQDAMAGVMVSLVEGLAVAGIFTGAVALLAFAIRTVIDAMTRGPKQV